MLFSEIYGSYFNVVAAILAEASEGNLTERKMTELVREKAFAESALTIPSALKSEVWPLLDREYRSVLHRKPTMPLTTLQKRWLKALLLLHGAFFPGCFLLPMLGVFPPVAAGEMGAGGTVALLFWCAYFLPVGALAYRHFGTKRN